MCQLTLTALNDSIMNKVATQILMNTNSKTIHKDGCGFYCDEILFKTEIAGSLLINNGQFLSEINSDLPIISHVRNASFPKKISDEFAHPFETENFVLAHNGTLEPTDESGIVDDLTKIDTQIFVDELNKNYKGNMIKAVQKTMAKFDGKFAFLIYDKRKKDYYVIKGKSADLHIVEVYLSKTNEKNIQEAGKYLGFIVNTEKEDLDKSFCLIRNLYYILTGQEIFYGKYVTDRMKIVTPETIFKLNLVTNALEKVGEVKETKIPTPVTRNYGAADSYVRPNYNHINPDNGVFESKKEKTIASISGEILNFCSEWDVNFEYIDLLFYYTMGTSILESEEDDAIAFIDVIFPMLLEFKSHPNIDKEWKALRKNYFISPILINKELGLQFPYFLDRNVKPVRELRKTKNMEHKKSLLAYAKKEKERKGQ